MCHFGYLSAAGRFVIRRLEYARPVNSKMSFWGTRTTDHSDKFLADLLKLNVCFVGILQDINDAHGTSYDVSPLEEMAETLEATAELEGSGFLPTSFYHYSTERSEDTWVQIAARNDAYFANTFRSFFNEKSQPIINVYMDLFTRKTASGTLMLDDDDRELMWEWIHSLAQTAVQHELELTDATQSSKHQQLLRHQQLFNQ